MKYQTALSRPIPAFRTADRLFACGEVLRIRGADAEPGHLGFVSEEQAVDEKAPYGLRMVRDLRRWGEFADSQPPPRRTVVGERYVAMHRKRHPED